jgi:hypothetical protein
MLDYPTYHMWHHLTESGTPDPILKSFKHRDTPPHFSKGRAKVPH